jgi:hypothetical protein
MSIFNEVYDRGCLSHAIYGTIVVLAFDSCWSFSHQANETTRAEKLRKAQVDVRLAIPVRETHGSAVIREPYNYEGDCAGADRFSMFIVKTSAANGNVFKLFSLPITENSSLFKLQYHLFVFGVCVYVPLARLNQLKDFHEIGMGIMQLEGIPNPHFKTIPYSL